MKKANKNKQIEIKNRVLYSILIIIVTLCVIVGVSYAAFKFQQTGTKDNQVTSGTLILELDDEEGTTVSLTGAMPTSDTKGKTLTPYTFTLRNTGTLNSRYRIKLEVDNAAITKDKCEANLLDAHNIRLVLTKNDSMQDVTNYDSLTDSVIDEDILNANDSNDYELRMWIDSSVTDPALVNGKHFHVKVVVDAIQDNYMDFSDM